MTDHATTEIDVEDQEKDETVPLVITDGTREITADEEEASAHDVQVGEEAPTLYAIETMKTLCP